MLNNGKRIVKRLTPEEVMDYVTLNKSANEAKKKRDALRDDLVMKLRGKHPKFPNTRFVNPTECEFVLPLSYSKRSQIDWEEFAKHLLLKAYKGDVDRVEKVMADAVLEAGYKRFPVLQAPKANVDYLMQKRQEKSVAA